MISEEVAMILLDKHYEQQIMKITIEHYDEKVSIETKHDDITFADFMQLVRKVAHTVGYGTKTINEWYNGQ